MVVKIMWSMGINYDVQGQPGPWLPHPPNTFLFELNGKGALGVSTYEVRAALRAQGLVKDEELEFGWLGDQPNQHFIKFHTEKDTAKQITLRQYFYGIKQLGSARSLTL